MRLFISFSVLIASIFLINHDVAASNTMVTKHFKVEGVCEKCKKNIEEMLLM